MTVIFLSGMLQGMEQLTSYLKSHSISQTVFAERIGVSQSALSKMCSGSISPALKTALDIARETGGAVPVEVWAVNSEGTAA